jgi:hypothetical protein
LGRKAKRKFEKLMIDWEEWGEKFEERSNSNLGEAH